jgi:sodium-dependent dicarboxylate transporter 2/3/5
VPQPAVLKKCCMAVLSKRKVLLIKLAVPFLLLGIILLIPTPAGLSRNGHTMFAILIFAAGLFVLQPVPLGIGGLLVLIMPVLLGVASPEKVFRSFSNPAVFFLIGAFIIAATVEKCGIHKRIALFYLQIAGKRPRLFILTTMIAGASLSFIMPEHCVIVLIVPVLMYILVGMKIRARKSNFGKAVTIGAAYGCSIGSLATPLGGARNPLTIGFLTYNNIQIDFLQWITIALPVVVISLFAIWGLLLIIWPPEIKDLGEAQVLIREEVEKLPKMTCVTIRVIVSLVIAVIMWIFLPHSTSIDLAVVALIGGVLIFLAGNMNWKEIENHIPWGIILLYGGAISLGIQLAESGAAEWLADFILRLTQHSTLAVIISLVCLTKLVTELMSNTAAVSLLLPIAYGIAKSMGLPPLMTCMLVGLSGGLAFSLLISTPGNIIAYSTGYFNQRQLFKTGIFANVITVVIILLVSYTVWKWMGVW